MAMISTVTMILGVVMTIVPGLICFAGPSGVCNYIEWAPFHELLLTNPAGSMLVGAAMTVISGLGPVTRIE